MPAVTAISIGNFDGVHRGHAALVAAAREAVAGGAGVPEVGAGVGGVAGVGVGADQREKGDEGDRRVDGGCVVVLSFDPHPVTLLRPGTPSRRLSRFEDRTRWLEAVGADEVVALPPTRALLDEPPDRFITRIVELYRPDFVVEGPDFRFGRGRAGDVETLRRLGAAHGFTPVVIEPAEAALGNQHVVRISSTLVRWLIERGRIGDAAALLGRPYELVGRVVPGDRRGRLLGVPTANVDHEDLLLPRDGIYAGLGLAPDGRWRPAAISVGTKPTFGAHPRLCEAHLVGYEGPLDHYGWTARIRFTHWLRDQLRYDDAAALVAQLRRDVARAAELAPEGAGEPIRT